MTDDVAESLCDAVIAGDVGATRAILAEYPELLKSRCRESLPWLTVAARRPSSAMVKLLIDLAFDVNDEGIGPSAPSWPLVGAVDRDLVENARLLLEHGANPNVGRVVIGAIVGTHRHSLELVQLLHQYGADLHQVYTNELTGGTMNALGEAVRWGKQDVAEYLRAQGCVMPPSEQLPQRRDDLDAEVVAYFEEHFGPVRREAILEVVPTEPRVAVRIIPPDSNRRYVTLFSTGMSSHAMDVPSGKEEFRFGEVFIQLPGDWNYSDLHNPEHGWPIAWLRSVAQYSHQGKRGLEGATVIANGNPPQPLGPDAAFTALLLLAERRFISRDGRTIQLYRMTPLYTEELNLERREGTAALMRAFDELGIPFVFDLHRTNVALV